MLSDKINSPEEIHKNHNVKNTIWHYLHLAGSIIEESLLHPSKTSIVDYRTARVLDRY